MRPREELSITAPRPTASRPGSRPAATRIVWLHRGGTVAARWVSPLTDRPPEVRSGTRARVLPPCRAHSQRVDHSRSVAWGSGASAPRPRHRLLVRMAGTHAVSRETAKQLPTEPALLGPLFGTDGAMLGSPRAGGPSLTWDPCRRVAVGFQAERDSCGPAVKGPGRGSGSAAGRGTAIRRSRGR